MPKLPKANSALFTADKGVRAISRIINDEFGWIFRQNHQEHDYGIDAYIDVLTENSEVTGQSLAVQIKTGSSYFKISDHTSITYYGETKHLNYYANISHPIILFVHDEDEQKTYWVQFKLEKTEKARSGWKIEIPKDNVFSAYSKIQMIDIVGPYIEYSDQLEEYWNDNQIIRNSDLIIYMIEKKEIKQKDVSKFCEFLERIKVNKSLEMYVQGRLLVFTDAYDEDERELWEIPAIRKWIKEADKKDIAWFYYLETHVGSWLKLAMNCYCDARRIGQSGSVVQMEISSKKLAKFLNKNFMRLNSVTGRLGMDAVNTDENKRISFAVMDALGLPREGSPIDPKDQIRPLD